MRRLLALVLIAWVAGFPIASYAQQSAPPAAPTMPQSSGFTSNKALAVGIGILVGAALVSVPVSVRGVTLLGAVAGGVLANWWYNQETAPPSLKAP
jgi:hypothetical protein